MEFPGIDEKRSGISRGDQEKIMWNFQWGSFVLFRSGISKVTSKPRNLLGFFPKSMSSTIPAWIFFGILYCNLLGTFAASYLAIFHI